MLVVLGGLFPVLGGCGSAGGTLAQSFHPRDEATLLGLCPPSPAWARPEIKFPSALPFYGQNPLQWELLGQTPAPVLSPAPWAVWKQSQCWSTADVTPWLATLDFAKCDRTQWFVKLHLLESWDGTRFWGLSPSRKRLQAKIWRAQPPPPKHTFWGV